MHTDARRTPIAFAITLIICSVVGWGAAMALMLEKLQSLEHPGQALICDVNPFIQCTRNLGSAQGAVLGFPNPILGLGAWIAPLVVAVGLLAGARFARWFWVVFNLGMFGGWFFVCWLQYQSIHTLGSLCPWCVLTWAVMIPAFWVTTFYCISSGKWSRAAKIRRVGQELLSWSPLVILINYVVIAVAAQLRFDLISYFFG